MASCLAINITPCSGRQEYQYCSKHYQQLTRNGKIATSRRDTRPAVIDGNIARIPLGVNAKDGYAIVDVEFAYLAEDNWGVNHYGYARRSRDKTLLHRVIMLAPKGKVVDHINHDILNCRQSNLRVCTQAQNSQNSVGKPYAPTKYKGVSITKQGKYEARLTHQYQTYHLGIFDTPSEAAKNYNIKALELRGEFARLNDGV